MSASDHDSRFVDPGATVETPPGVPARPCVSRIDAELQDMVLDIDQSGEGLTEWEITFIARLIDSRAKRFTPAQAKQIRRIHQERVS